MVTLITDNPATASIGPKILVIFKLGISRAVRIIAAV